MTSFDALTFASADQRRSLAKKFAAHLPADIASAAAALNAVSTVFPAPSEPPLRDPETLTVHDLQFTVLPRVRILSALVEPNTLPMGRNMTLRRRSISTQSDTDGVYVTRWNTLADHEAAYRDSFEHYLSTHDLVTAIAHGATLDSWHSPLLLVPVRHEYADGTRPVSALMAADGTARIWGARMALAADLSAWGVTHEWTDPSARWTLGVADIRKAVAAARTQVAAIDAAIERAIEQDPDTTIGRRLAGVSSGSVEDWANILTPGFTFSDLGMYLYHTHSTHTPVEDGPFCDEVVDWVQSIDVFRGVNPFDLLGMDPADPVDREQVVADAEELHRDLLTVVTNKDQTARRVALMANAVSYLPSGGETVEEVEVSRSELFHRWLGPALTRTRALHWAAVPGIVRLRHTLATMRSFPDCDLYGVNGDLGSHSLYAPLDDPTSEWFTLTTMRGLTYAILHGHLDAVTTARSEEFMAAEKVLDDAYEALVESVGEDAAIEQFKHEMPDEFAIEERLLPIMGDFADSVLTRLLTTTEGHAVVLHYAAHAAAGTVPENRFRYRVVSGQQRVEFVESSAVS
jgi:hypothetical protein